MDCRAGQAHSQDLSRRCEPQIHGPTEPHLELSLGVSRTSAGGRERRRKRSRQLEEAAEADSRLYYDAIMLHLVARSDAAS